MKHDARALTAAIAALALLCCGAPAGHAAPLTAKTLATLDRLSDPQVSPDGRFVAYDLRTVDYDAQQIQPFHLAARSFRQLGQGAAAGGPGRRCDEPALVA